MYLVVHRPKESFESFLCYTTAAAIAVCGHTIQHNKLAPRAAVGHSVKAVLACIVLLHSVSCFTTHYYPSFSFDVVSELISFM